MQLYIYIVNEFVHYYDWCNFNMGMVFSQYSAWCGYMIDCLLGNRRCISIKMPGIFSLSINFCVSGRRNATPTPKYITNTTTHSVAIQQKVKYMWKLHIDQNAHGCYIWSNAIVVSDVMKEILIMKTFFFVSGLYAKYVHVYVGGWGGGLWALLHHKECPINLICRA